MPRKPKKTHERLHEDPEKASEQRPEDEGEKGGYYYDDTHGYQTYTGEEDDDQFESGEEDTDGACLGN